MCFWISVKIGQQASVITQLYLQYEIEVRL